MPDAREAVGSGSVDAVCTQGRVTERTPAVPHSTDRRGTPSRRACAAPCHHAPPMTAGHDDLARAAATLAARIPAPLAPLARLAFNYRWSWTPGGPALFADLDPVRWERCGENPVRALSEVAPETLERAAADDAYLQRIAAVEAAVQADLARPVADAPATADRPIAYFCAEFGVHRSLPIYSGGLGALAGDILKEASDRALPLVAVGLLYRQGYFRQRIDAGGWQHEYWVDTDPERLPAALVTRRRRRAGHDHRPGPRPAGHRADLARRRRPRRRCTCSTPSARRTAWRPLDHVAALRRRARRAARAVHPARRRRRAGARRDGDRARAAPPQRGPCRVHLARGGARPRRLARGRRSPPRAGTRSSPRTRRCRRATTRTRPTRCSMR